MARWKVELSAASRAGSSPGGEVANRLQNVGHAFAVEDRGAGALLPAEAFETGVTLSPRVDPLCPRHRAAVRLLGAPKLIGRRVRVLLRATEVLVFDGARKIAAHPCAVRRS